MTRDKMIARFYELEDALNNTAPPKLATHESGMKYTSPDVAEMMVQRQALAFRIARSMPRPPQKIAIVTVNP